MIGDVVAVAQGEKKWKVGDRVGGSWHGGHDGIIQRWVENRAAITDKVSRRL